VERSALLRLRWCARFIIHFLTIGRKSMFKNHDVFSSFSVSDIPAAKAFYTQTLGLDVSEENGMGLIELRLANGGRVLLYPKTDHTPATFTVLNIAVDDIEQAVDALVQRGVRFEHYSGETQTDEKGIFRVEGVQQAWFKDPAGNILSVIQAG
jgi:predicted enzyme related to lactoylglutathione lyase